MKFDTPLFGFLPVYKPPGPTSHDVVARVRRLLPRKTKVGHTGTLDPFAEGVLIVAIGKATRFADDVHTLPKSYRARVALGSRTDTLDPTGTVDAEAPVPPFDTEDLARVAAALTGPQDQMPPVFSAKKVNGRKSYDLARNNQAPELKPSRITIHDLALTRVDDHTLTLDTTCSTGTYIRALGRDIGTALGTCAHLSTLIRTAVGPVDTSACVAMEALGETDLEAYMWPVSRLLPAFPEVRLPDDALPLLLQGRPYPAVDALPPVFLGVVADPDGPLAVFRCIYDPGMGEICAKMQCWLRREGEST